MHKKIDVWDPAVRVFHWGLGALVLAAFLTADDALALHARIGLAVLGMVAFRIGWGIWGSAPARFSAFVRSPRAVLAYARAYVRGRPPAHTSHNPLGAVMVLALLGVLLAIVVTGALVQAGPAHGGLLAGTMSVGAAHDLEELHEALTGLLLALIGMHVAGVVVSSFLERQNLVLAMITGRKRGGEPPPSPPPSPVRTTAGLLGAAVLGYAAIRAVVVLLPISEASAGPRDTPAALLTAYEAEARQEEPGFTGADAARGNALYLREVRRGAEATSCASCHTRDPRQPGRSSAGKAIAPLAPSANPERFTDRKKADRWFDRNCKQVIGRRCTAAEKSDLLRFLLTR